MAFGPPTFNLLYNLWIPPNASPSPPDVANAPGQLYVYSRVAADIDPTDTNSFQPTIWLRVPKDTVIAAGQVVEVASGDGWFYTVRFTERFHRAFPNEYLGCLLSQNSSSPPSAGFILLEGGDFILLEDGSKIKLE